MINSAKDWLAKMTFMNDPLFKVAAKNKDFRQELLRVLYNDLLLIVFESDLEWSIVNPLKKEVKLNTRCVTSDGKLIDIEVQNSNQRRHTKKSPLQRVAFNR